MNIYEKKSRWKIWLLLTAIVIVSASLWYTNRLATNISVSEKKKVELIANTYQQINHAQPETDISYLFQVINSNESVPIILTDEKDRIKGSRNLDSLKIANDSRYLYRQLRSMKEANEPIEIDITEDLKEYIYYKDSYLLTQLRFFPYVQFGIIGIFLFTSYLAFSTARKAEQNQVWVGMAKETAHQLGTPLSSMNAWLELLKNKITDSSETENFIDEIGNDLNRLELITERFSKIGSEPILDDCNIISELEDMVAYFSKRVSDKVIFTLKPQNDGIIAKINPALFTWVIENLLKNALDTMKGEGTITLSVSKQSNNIYIDIADPGIGIPKTKHSTIFQPGFSTKRRGWGLGLSLSKRIIENYHNGKIFVKGSITGKGTTFRIVLPG